MTAVDRSAELTAACGIGSYAVSGPDAASLVAQLRRRGCRAYLLTGGSAAADWIVLMGIRTFDADLGGGCPAKGIVLVAPDRDGRDLCETAAFAAGFRKHGRYHHLAPYWRADVDCPEYASLLERVPAEAEAAFPLRGLLAERDLHMDMARVNGRRSDAHTARYRMAADLAKPGDVVVDVACGYGYGSRIIAENSLAARVVGIDLAAPSVDYASAHYGGGRVSFRTGDATDLSGYADATVDLIASFETVEHLRDPERFFAEAQRVLRPGGRLVMSVPNRWLDASGKDPNPFHFQVYDPERVRADLGRHFRIEKLAGQTAGGNDLRCPDAPRDIFDLDGSRDCEWVLAVGFHDAKASSPYEERVLPYVSPPRLALDWTKLY